MTLSPRFGSTRHLMSEMEKSEAPPVQVNGLLVWQMEGLLYDCRQQLYGELTAILCMKDGDVLQHCIRH